MICPVCNGQGVVEGIATCNNCGGKGWDEPPSPLSDWIDEAIKEWDKLEGKLPPFPVFLKNYISDKIRRGDAEVYR